MIYVRVNWIHSNPDYPSVIIGELEDDRTEVRKIEMFSDGKIGFASQTESSGGTGLGPEPWPPLEQIDEDDEFELFQISREEFERIWQSRHASAKEVS